MAGISDKVQIGQSADFLEGVAVDTSAGTGLFREGVVVSDPELEGARQRVLDTEPAADDFGAVVRVAGIPLVDIQAGYSNNDPLFVGWNGSQQVTVSGTVNVNTQGGQTVATTGDWLTDAELRAAPVVVSTGLTQPTTPADTQPVSATSLPLPSGASTAAKQLPDNHQVQVSNFPASFGASQVGAWTVSVDNFPAIQPISAASLPLPTGAATEAKQLPDNHQVQVSNFPLVQDVDTGLDQPLTDAQLRSAPVSVDTGLTQPTTPADTQPVSVASLPLPTGAAIEAKQLPDNHQVQVSNFPAEYPLPAAQVAALAAPAVQQVSGTVTANQGTTPWIVSDPSAFNLLNRTPPAAGAYGYSAGVSGTVTVAASRRVVMFSCVAGGSGASVTINGGDAIAVPANRPLTIEPRGNLVAPTIVFTGTVTYFVEHVL